MTALRLTVFCLLICGTTGFEFLFNLFYKCNPPQKLLGKFCAAILDNDRDLDGIVDNRDFDADLLMYDYDDNLCQHDKWEVVTWWSCRYGWSKEYGRFMFNRFDRNRDRVMNATDFSGPVSFTNSQFLSLQYTRFKNDYCGVPENRNNPIDRVLCAEVDAMRPEEVRCN